MPLRQHRCRPAEAGEEFVRRDPESDAKLESGVGASDLLASLDFPDDGAMNFRLEAELFLAHPPRTTEACEVRPESRGEFPILAPDKLFGHGLEVDRRLVAQQVKMQRRSRWEDDRAGAQRKAGPMQRNHGAIDPVPVIEVIVTELQFPF